MSSKKLGILAIIAAVMVVWAVVVSNRSEQSTVSKPTRGGYLLQGLDPDDVAKIEVTSNAGTEEAKKVTLNRSGGHFVVAQKNNYPAKIDRVNDIFERLLDVKIDEHITDNPENFEDLGLTEEDAQYTIKVYNASDELVTGLICGDMKSAEGGSQRQFPQNSGRFVKIINSNDAYLTRSRLYFGADPINYIDQKLVAVDADKISMVKISSPLSSYTLTRDPNSSQIVCDKVVSKKLDQNKAKETFNALSSLRFEDVMKPAEAIEMDFNTGYVCDLDNDQRYTLDIASKGEDYYIKLKSEFTDPNPVTKGSNVESEEELKKKEAKLLAAEEVAKFNSRHNGWVYKLHNWQAEKLTRSAEELVAEEKENSQTQ
jgi:hypothetical protein